MTPQELISSGTLELYVLGDLSPEERTEVEALAASHPEIREEIRQIEEALGKYALLHTRNPSPEIRSRIMGEIDGESPAQEPLHNSESGGHTAEHSATPTPLYNNTLRYYLAAASIALVIFMGSTFYFWYQWQETSDELALAVNQNLRIAEDVTKTNAVLDELNEELGVLRDNETVTVTMASVESAPAGSLAKVYWNPVSQKVYLDVESLPTPPDDKQYQLWAIADGTPVDAGVFDVDTNTDGLRQMKTIAGAQAFAVTLEPRGGSKSPTLEAMYVLGAIEEG